MAEKVQRMKIWQCIFGSDRRRKAESGKIKKKRKSKRVSLASGPTVNHFSIQVPHKDSTGQCKKIIIIRNKSI